MDYEKVRETLDHLTINKDDDWPRAKVIIGHGSAPGADALADFWAVSRHVPVKEYPANWYPDGKTLDRSAGPKRNSEMLKDFKPDLVVAFPGGTGTADMVRKARKAGVPVVQIIYA